MSNVVEKHLYSYKLNEVPLSRHIKFDEKCFIETTVVETKSNGDEPPFFAEVTVYVPSHTLIDAFFLHDVSIPLGHVRVDSLREDEVEGDWYYGDKYSIGCNTVEDAKTAVDAIKQKIFDRMNELNNKGILKGQILAGPISTYAFGERVYAYAILRTTEEGKSYVERKYLLPAWPLSPGSKLTSVHKDYVPMLDYLSDMNKDRKSESWLRPVTLPSGDYMVYEFVDPVKEIDDLKSLVQQYEKIISSDLYGAEKYVVYKVAKQHGSAHDEQDIIFNVGKNKIEGSVEEDIKYDPKKKTYSVKLTIYSPYIFSTKDMEDLSKFIANNMSQDTLLDYNVVATVSEGIKMNGVEITLKPMSSRDKIETLLSTFVANYKGFIEQRISQRQAQTQKQEER